MTDLLVYSNSSVTTYNGNNYIVNGIANTFAIPIHSFDFQQEDISVVFSGIVQSQNSFVWPSATLGDYGIDFIEAPDTSVEVEVRVYGYDPSQANVLVGSSLVTLNEAKEYLTIASTTYDSKLSQLIIYASGLIESYCSRSFTANSFTEYKNGGLPFVMVDNPPIISLTSVSEYNGSDYTVLVSPPSGGGLPNVSANASSVPGYSYDGASGRIWKGINTGVSSSINNGQSFAPYMNGIKVTYTGGYTYIPADIKLCCLAIVKDLHKGMEAKVTQFDRERIEQMPYCSGFPPHIRRILDLYRLIV